MKILAIVILLCVAACHSGTSGEVKQPVMAEQIVGGDKGVYGCVSSAGYTWSVVRDSCIRVFEVGTPFVRYDVNTGLTDSLDVAYLTLSDDGFRAEVFFGPTDKPIVMDALPLFEGETMPVLYENVTERLKVRSHRDTYQLLFLDTVRYLQYYNAEKGLGKWLKKEVDAI
jgi:hypothetical protein